MSTFHGDTTYYGGEFLIDNGGSVGELDSAIDINQGATIDDGGSVGELDSILYYFGSFDISDGGSLGSLGSMIYYYGSSTINDGGSVGELYSVLDENVSRTGFFHSESGTSNVATLSQLANDMYINI